MCAVSHYMHDPLISEVRGQEVRGFHSELLCFKCVQDVWRHVIIVYIYPIISCKRFSLYVKVVETQVEQCLLSTSAASLDVDPDK